MPRLARAIGQLKAGVPAFRAAASFGVSPGTISKLRAKFNETSEVKDRPPQSQDHHRVPPEFGSGEDGMACCESRLQPN